MWDWGLPASLAPSPPFFSCACSPSPFPLTPSTQAKTLRISMTPTAMSTEATVPGRVEGGETSHPGLASHPDWIGCWTKHTTLKIPFLGFRSTFEKEALCATWHYGDQVNKIRSAILLISP